jgi:hypothetical protein
VKYLFFSSVLFLLGCSRITAEKSNANSLTPKEIADGWILLFDGETTFGWEVDGEAKIKDGVLALGGDKATIAQTTFSLVDFELGFEYRLSGQQEAYFLLAKLIQKGEYSRMGLDKPGKNASAWNQVNYKVQSNHDTGEQIETGRTLGASGIITWKWQHDGIAPHSIALQVSAGSKLEVRNIKLKPLALKPIFNGKDLSGWKEFLGKKSEFSVTPEGWLTIKNGPGDLQTEGQYADFILQLECISNGEHLNSGVFFRCRPGEYQQGYEAQIRNQFTAEPTQEYTLEFFDEKTGELKEKKKAKSTAVDYGTGGIYRRYPARKEVAKDHEWFTMTIIARGRHIAVWVNGIQVTDWTDTRPIKDNARNGCRLEKGPISLQGHDPTTDLGFRNIRIAELPKTE